MSWARFIWFCASVANFVWSMGKPFVRTPIRLPRALSYGFRSVMTFQIMARICDLSRSEL